MQVKSLGPQMQTQRALVVGGGETAADVVVELCRAGAKSVTWSIPNGQQFFRKHAAVTHLGWLLSLLRKQSNRIVLDEASSRAIRSSSAPATPRASSSCRCAIRPAYRRDTSW